MTHETAKQLFGSSFLGKEELQALPLPFSFIELSVPSIPFSDEVLMRCAMTHILIFAPKCGVNLLWLRENFGTDPAKQPCMYNQDWYVKEAFASKCLDGAWHLIPRVVREEYRAERPETIEETLRGESFPSAILCAFTFFSYWCATGGEQLWKHDFLWCDDRDHNSDWIYVGRYEDPSGVNKNGFNIHRHLALRSAYSAAPEVTL